jgi:flagellar FliJ protein
MKFKFRFENVLKHRKIMEDVAQRDFQEANSLLNVEIEKLNNMIHAAHEAQEHLFEKQKQGGPAGPALSQVHDFLKGQDIRIARQRQKVQEYEKVVENLREILRHKAIEYKIMEGLKSKNQEEFKKEQNKKEQKNLDDLALMRSRVKEK